MTEVLIENFGEYKTWNSDKMSTVGENLLEKIFANDKSASKIAVEISKTTDRGVVEEEEIYIYDSYINALEEINKNEYNKNIAVEVFEINYHGYAHMMYKAFDGVCYSRYAHPSFYKYDLCVVRTLFDNNVLVFECCFEYNE
jgi:hypothetical protein